VFVFLGDIEPRDLMKGISMAVNIGDFDAIIHDDGIACQIETNYNENFDEEIRRPAMLAMDCVALSQAVDTSRVLLIKAKRWIDIRMSSEDIKDKLTIGSILHPSDLPVANQDFLKDFKSGLKYANQAFSQTIFRLSLEDYVRSLDSIWDEAIYHCQHCLECIKDYFGTWDKMRRELNVDETDIRSVTDFSAKYIRHGANRAKLQELPEVERVKKAQEAQVICKNTIAFFGIYLDEHGITCSNTWEFD
jgi:hypothetical protein